MRPYLSIVVAARNDNYGGDFLRRMQLFLSILATLSDRCGLRAELLIVEWNPPADRPPLRDSIDWPCNGNSLDVGIVTVPEQVHRALPNAGKMPMFEYIAKNVGIRRAKGEYILASNPDIVFSQELFQYLASHRLRGDAFYRVDRFDVNRTVPLALSVERQLRFCSTHAFLIRRMEGDQPTSRLARIYRWLAGNLPRLQPQRVVRGLVRRGKRLAGFTEPPNGDRQPPIPLVHTNASGDFLLMESGRWKALRGFPELPTHSHIDSYMVYAAAVAGLQQVVLPYRVYHQEHDRSEQLHRPLTILNEIPAFKRMLEVGEVHVTNDENWGLGQLELPTAEVGRKVLSPE
jgi:hypothetical protein